MNDNVRDPMDLNASNTDAEEDYTHTAIIDLNLNIPLIKQLLNYDSNDISLKWFINGTTKNGSVSGKGLLKQVVKMIYDEMKNGLPTDTKDNRNNYLLKQDKFFYPGGKQFMNTNIDEKFANILGHIIVIEGYPIPFAFTPCLLYEYLMSIPKQDRRIDLDRPSDLIEFYQIGHPEYYQSLMNIPEQLSKELKKKITLKDLTFKQLDDMFGFSFKEKAMKDLFSTNPIIKTISTHFMLYLGQLEYENVSDLIKKVYCLNLVPEDRSSCFIVEPISFHDVFQKFVSELNDTEFINLIQHSTGMTMHTVTDIIKVMLYPMNQDIGFDTCKRIIGINDKIYTLSDLNDRVRPLLSLQDLNMIDERKK